MNPENRSILPPVAFRSFVSRYVKPALSEGFQDITNVEFMARNVLHFPYQPCLLRIEFTSLMGRQSSGVFGASIGLPNSQHEVSPAGLQGHMGPNAST